MLLEYRIGAPSTEPDAGPAEDAGRADAGGPDAGSDAGPACVSRAGRSCLREEDCDDGCFCTREFCNGGFCETLAPTCDDQIPCTIDRCDEARRACVREPDDALCDDGDLCTTAERCDPEVGCLRGFPRNCSDGDACTVDACEPGVGCRNVPRDLDGDGQVAVACGGQDCDDDPLSGPEVNTLAVEDCGDAIDNDCDGLEDLFDPEDCPAANDRCAAAERLALSGRRVFSTFGLGDRAVLSCEPAASPTDAVFVFTTVAVRRLEVEVGAVGVSLELRRFEDCETGPALACDVDEVAGAEDEALLEVDDLEPGTYALWVGAPAERLYELEFRLIPPVPPPGTAACDARTPTLRTGAILTGSFTDHADVYPSSSCGVTGGLDVAYRLSLGASRDLRARARGFGADGAGRDLTYRVTRTCSVGPDLACGRSSDSAIETVFLPDLAAGDYWLVLEGDDLRDLATYRLDLSLVPRPAPGPGDTCTTARRLTSTATLDFDLAALRYDGGVPCASRLPTYVDGFAFFEIDRRRSVTVETDGAFHLAALGTFCGGGDLACVASDVAGRTSITQVLDPGTYFVGVTAERAPATAPVSLTTELILGP